MALLHASHPQGHDILEHCGGYVSMCKNQGSNTWPMSSHDGGTRKISSFFREGCRKTLFLIPYRHPTRLGILQKWLKAGLASSDSPFVWFAWSCLCHDLGVMCGAPNSDGLLHRPAPSSTGSLFDSLPCPLVPQSFSCAPADQDHSLSRYCHICTSSI